MTSDALVDAARRLSEAVNGLSFSAPVTHVLNPLDYAWAPHEAYLRKFGNGKKRVIFMGMNPGPFGMVQVGVPFGEVNAVRDWMKIEAPVGQPRLPNPNRQVLGFGCKRSEPSGKKLWGFFSSRFPNAEDFFLDHFVLNYCPLAFFDHSKNVTPDVLAERETRTLFAACDKHLLECVAALEPIWVIGVGKFAEKRARHTLSAHFPALKIGSIHHPSPLNRQANREGGWSVAVEKQLIEMRLV